MTHTASSERLIQNMIGSEVIAQVMDPGNGLTNIEPI